MIQLFSIRMIRPVGLCYKDDNHVLSLYEIQQGGNIYRLGLRAYFVNSCESKCESNSCVSLNKYSHI